MTNIIIWLLVHINYKSLLILKLLNDIIFLIIKMDDYVIFY